MASDDLIFRRVLHCERFTLYLLVVAEALERLLLQLFVYEMQNNPDCLLLESLSIDPEEKLTETVNTQIKKVSQLYEDCRNSVRNGKLGKTATFWLTYLDLVRMQHVIHTSIQENDFEKRVLGWKYFIPFYFALNYFIYARYGSYYVQVLE